MISKITRNYVFENEYKCELVLTMKTSIKGNKVNKIESIEIFDKTGNYMLLNEEYPKGWVELFNLDNEIKKIEAKLN